MNGKGVSKVRINTRKVMVIDIMLIQEKLLDWYELNQRILPFRENNDPYRIWVSEVMLQQTQVNTVIPYYNRFMKVFPTVFDLARANEEEVYKL